MLFLTAWAWIAYYFCVSLEQAEWWKIWMVVGMPFGIHRMYIWLLSKNYDIGGTVGVWTMNIIAVKKFILWKCLEKIIYKNRQS